LVALVRDVAAGVEEIGAVPPDVLTAWTRQVGVVRKRIRGEAEAPEPPRETGEQTIDRVSAGLDRILDATTPRHTMVI
ncbi:MAG: hypothetical protein J2O46_08080, partial [Nocardioides sp.]|nr:hypothetical protein [Nocardioides sp.]